MPVLVSNVSAILMMVAVLAFALQATYIAPSDAAAEGAGAT